MELIDGFFGKNHVTAAQMGDCLSGEIGLDKYVLNVGTKFKATIVSNNLITLESGVLCDQGRRAVTPHGNVESLIIENGAQGMNRNDLIAFHYSKDNASSVESGEFCVIKGQEGTTASDPTYTTGNIREGATEDYFPLYRVKIVGLSIKSVEPLFDVLASLKELKDKCSALNESLATTNKNVTSVKSIADSAVKTAASNLTFSSSTVFTAQGAAPCSVAGKMGTVYTVFTVNSVIKAGDVIAAIPSGYRPKVDYKNIPILKCGDYTNVYTVNLLTTGIITAAKDMPIGIYQLGLSYATS